MEKYPPTDGQTQDTHVQGASGDRRRRRPPRLGLVASTSVILLAGCTGLLPTSPVGVSDDPSARPDDPVRVSAPDVVVEPGPWPTPAVASEPEPTAPLIVPASSTGSAVVVAARVSSRIAATRAAGLAAMRKMPRTGKVSIAWSHPALGGHLGAVRKGSTSQILVNDKKLAGNQAKMRDVVRHEVAHIYQGQVMQRYGLTWEQLGARMRPAFGANPHEKAADCVARSFGARWTYYTASCGSKAKQKWVKALVAGRLP